MSSNDSGERPVGGGPAYDAVQLLAGAVEVGLEQAEGLLRRLRGLLGRSDLLDLVADGHEDLRARGEIALQRIAPTSESHLEALARRSMTMRQQTYDA